MRNAFLAIMLALLTTACAAGNNNNAAVFEANPNFSDISMAAALKRESAFCAAVSQGDGNAYAHVADLPARDFYENFSLRAGELGYADHLGTTQKSRTDYMAAYVFAPNASRLRDEERALACMRRLGWKSRKELNAREQLQIDKNNRAEALIDKIRQDPLAAKSIRVMSANMYGLSPDQVVKEKRRLFTEPDTFEDAYMRARLYVHKYDKESDARILAAATGVSLARCSAMYGAVNEKRQGTLSHVVNSGDRLLEMEKESLNYAGRMIHADIAELEKQAYAEKLQREAGPGLSRLIVRFKEESAQCATILQRCKRDDLGQRLDFGKPLNFGSLPR